MKRPVNKLDRRNFIDLLGKGTISTALLPYYITACQPAPNSGQNVTTFGIAPSEVDNVILAEGLQSNILIRWGDRINDHDTFGFNNDFLCFLPLDNSAEEGLLWVNHEYVHPLFIHGKSTAIKTREDVDKEIYEVGGSILHIKKTGENWKLVYNSPHNRRITGFSKIPFDWKERIEIEGSSESMGMVGNCAGGMTPWGSFLSCEENYDIFYGDRPSSKIDYYPSSLNWENFYPNPPEHYGWVVDIDPKTGASKKHIGLGRCAHESATVKQMSDGRLVIYSGDDKNDECLYKFISAKPNSLKEGTLYVANIDIGEWIPIDIEQNADLRNKFPSQLEALIYLREAAKIVGGSPLDRPEDIEIDPVNGNILVALTNNIPNENYFGSILKIEEENGKHDSLKFTSSTYIAGGEETGFASPDNMVFDRKGNLWFTSDISGNMINHEPYSSFKNNGLFLIMREGQHAGEVIQIASAPVDAEFCGPWFSPKGKTLFLCVQHPGEQSPGMDQLTSHWPDGDNAIPRSAVIEIYGPTLNEIQGIS